MKGLGSSQKVSICALKEKWNRPGARAKPGREGQKMMYKLQLVVISF